MPPIGVQEARLVDFSLVASDFDGDPLVYDIVGTLPEGVAFDRSNGRFEWTPNHEQAGRYDLRFRVVDPSGATDAIDIVVDVADVNRPPQIHLADHKVLVGERLALTIGGSDPDLGETLRFQADGLPEGALRSMP